MSRAIISGTDAPSDTAPGVDPALTLTKTVPAAPPSPTEAPDALAGALPAWDLLPATPFVRRVK
ncbi:hypothetical protein [Variovorax sp. GB1P17]|uniref:hypothetical protein n=1 Tax=Variovorax sp. GB1P17 TaxID=3443740 RepID=UPI003F452617